MGNEASAPTATSTSAGAGAAGPRSIEISSLIQYAQSNYEENPTDALSVLMQAMTLNSGQAKANEAMDRIRVELGSDLANHVLDRTDRVQRATRIVQELLQDESTILYERGQQHILKEAMEDGSSLVCTKCNALVSAARWKQHQTYWCDAIEPQRVQDKDQIEDHEMIF